MEQDERWVIRIGLLNGLYRRIGYSRDFFNAQETSRSKLRKPENTLPIRASEYSMASWDSKPSINVMPNVVTISDIGFHYFNLALLRDCFGDSFGVSWPCTDTFFWTQSGSLTDEIFHHSFLTISMQPLLSSKKE